MATSHSISCCLFILQIVSFALQKYCLCVYIKLAPLYFLIVVQKIKVLYLGLWSIFSRCFNRVSDTHWVSSIWGYLLFIAQHHLLRGLSLSQWLFGTFVKNQIVLSVWGHFWVSYSIPMVYVSAFVPVPCNFLKSDVVILSAILFILRIALNIW
jgi:hypothetical protein